jgi:DNA-binding NarL/FixJ family response regulator
MDANPPPRVAIVDDHPLVRQGIGNLLNDELGAEIVASTDRLDEVLALGSPPDLLLLDLDLGDATPDAQAVASLVTAGIPVLVVSALGSAKAIREMLRSGVAGFISKKEPPQVLVDAVSEVLATGRWTGPAAAAAIIGDPDRPHLSPQEERVLVLYASGLKLVSAARAVGISLPTAKTYVNRIRAKYEQAGRPVPTKTDLYREAVRDGYLE